MTRKPAGHSLHTPARIYGRSALNFKLAVLFPDSNFAADRKKYKKTHMHTRPRRIIRGYFIHVWVPGTCADTSRDPTSGRDKHLRILLVLFCSFFAFCVAVFDFLDCRRGWVSCVCVRGASATATGAFLYVSVLKSIQCQIGRFRSNNAPRTSDK